MCSDVTAEKERVKKYKMSDYDFFATKDVSAISRKIGKNLFRKLTGKFREVLPPGASDVIEVGTGDGTFAHYCRNTLSINYTGYEPNTTMYHRLTDVGYTMHNTKVPPLKEMSATQDAVIMISTLEHAESPEHAFQMLSESNRVLKTGGAAFISVPDFKSWGSDFYNLDYTHTFPTTEVRLRQLLTDTGFTSLKFQWYWGDRFSVIGRLLNFVIRSGRSCVSPFLPRSIERSTRYQKMGSLYAANILVTGIKQR